MWSLRGLILDVPEWDICSVCSCLLLGRDLVRRLRFTSRIMNALFVCPYFQLAPLKVNRKVKEMSHCEYKCHSAQKKWKKKKFPSQVFQRVPNSLCFTVLLGSYKSKSQLRSAEVVRHPRVSKGLGFGNCSCQGLTGGCWWRLCAEIQGNFLGAFGSFLLLFCKTNSWSL